MSAISFSLWFVALWRGIQYAILTYETSIHQVKNFKTLMEERWFTEHRGWLTAASDGLIDWLINH